MRSRATKRGRVKSSKPSMSSRRSRTAATNPIRTIWPYMGKGLGQAYDPFPSQIKCIMRYSQVVTLNPGYALIARQVFRCNSIYDPDYSGLGHQPYGHDQYQSLYNQYQVLESVITMTPVSNVAGMFGIAQTVNPALNSGFDHSREMKGTQFSVMNGNNNQNNSIVSYYKDSDSFPEGASDATTRAAAFGANPTEEMYFSCWYSGIDYASDADECNFLFTITYTCVCYELKDLDGS